VPGSIGSRPTCLARSWRVRIVPVCKPSRTHPTPAPCPARVRLAAELSIGPASSRSVPKPCPTASPQRAGTARITTEHAKTPTLAKRHHPGTAQVGLGASVTAVQGQPRRPTPARARDAPHPAAGPQRKVSRGVTKPGSAYPGRKRINRRRTRRIARVSAIDVSGPSGGIGRQAKPGPSWTTPRRRRAVPSPTRL